jgi:hypothetical protein
LRKLHLIATAAVLVAAALVAGCGSSSSSSSSAAKASVTYTKAGKFTVPKTISGGLVEVSLKNQDTKAPHTAQLVQVTGGHSTQDAIKFLSANSNKTPDWIRAQGGPSAAPGQTAKATVNLPNGTYVISDLGGPGSSGPPATASVKVSGGSQGSLPSTDTTVTGAEKGKDKYAWDVAGNLKTGDNQITFKAEGKKAIHLLGAFRINGKHSNGEIVKALEGGGPPPYVDQQSFTTTSILDGGLSQVTDLHLTKPGTYVLFCPLTDRDGGKPHFAEGMLTQVTVK